MSSNDIAIKVENISKLYRIGVKKEMQDSFASVIFNFIKSPWKNYRKFRSLYKFDDIKPDHIQNSENLPSDIILAVNNVTFEASRGEVIGIVGGNGAGKSTLLKILCRITKPTVGQIKIRGTTSSLLEVGTGFHPELTGRENIYLNGTIIGMTKKEVDRKYDEIVDFSGIVKFIDTPVKRYSSGMRVRLAFSVAAHLEPENLIIDEVLAVGDVAFQNKCIGKMESMASKGRTVLFVSHNMSAITRLCTRAIWLDNGGVRMDGTTSDVVNAYLSSGVDGRTCWHRNGNLNNSKSNKEFEFRSIKLLDNQKEIKPSIPFNRKLKLEINYEIFNSIKYLSITYQMLDSNGVMIYESINTDNEKWKGYKWRPGSYVALCDIPEKFLLPGRYYISIAAFIEGVKIIVKHESVLVFDISVIGYNLNLGRLGIVAPIINWNIHQKSELLADNKMGLLPSKSVNITKAIPQ